VIISFLSPIYKDFQIKIMQPNSKLADIKDIATEVTDNYGIDGAEFPAHSFVFSSPVVGVWQIYVVSSSEAVLSLEKTRSSKLPQVNNFSIFFYLFLYFFFHFLKGRVIVANYSPYKMYFFIFYFLI
jgi:hypothetical protein